MTIFFDVDHTLLRKSCGELYGKYLFKRGLLPLTQVLRISWWALEHRMNLLKVDDFIERSMSWLGGKTEAWLSETCIDCIQTSAAPFFYKKGLARIAEHRARDERIYLLSAASRYIIEPIVDMLKLDGCLATELEVERGIFTGRLIHSFCYGEGKLIRLKEFCKANKLSLKDCAYYGDSYSDVPVLKNVGRPYAVNPDLRLWREAKANGWEILRF